jgi:ankyrin repeat protein
MPSKAMPQLKARAKTSAPSKVISNNAKAQLNAALFAATRAADLRQMEALLKKGANSNARTGGYKSVTPIFLAIEAKSVSAVRLLINHKANVSADGDPDFLPEDGLSHTLARQISPLDYAASINQIEIVRLLLQAGAQSFGENQTAQVFSIAAGSNAIEIMRMLLDDDKGQSRSHNASSALWRAASKGHVEMAKLLIRSGADQESCNEALLEACDHSSTNKNKLEIGLAALESAADPNVKDFSGNQPLILLVFESMPVYESLEDFPFSTEGLPPQEVERIRKAIDDSRTLRKQVLHLVRQLIAKGAKPDALSKGGYTPLLLALEKGEADFVQALLEGGANPNYAPAPFPSPLRFLARSGKLGQFHEHHNMYGDSILTADAKKRIEGELGSKDITLARLLIEKGANLKVGDARSALGEAAYDDNTALVHYFLEQGADPNYPFVPLPYFMSPVHRALTTSAKEAAKQEKDFNSQYTKQRINSYAPLHLAAAVGNLEIVRELLAAGVDTKARDAEGNNALIFLARGGRNTSIEAAERRTASLVRGVVSGHMGENDIIKPLPAHDMAKLSNWAAAEDGAIATALLEKGCDVNAVNSKGESPLDLASRNSDVSLVDLLLTAGAKTSRETALFKVIQNGRRQRRTLPALTKLQLNLTDADRLDLWYTADFGSKQLESKAQARRDRITAFAERAYLLKLWGEKDADVISRLIEKGANVNARNVAGLTPLMLAARMGQVEVVKTLIKAGADTQATNRSGETIPVQIAKYGTGHISLPLQEEPTREEGEKWMKLPVIKKRAMQVSQMLKREDDAMIALLNAASKSS